MSKKIRIIRGKLVSVTSQRVQYKPYGYELSFPSVWLELEIPADTVIEDVKSSEPNGDDGYIVIGLDGLQAILKITADAIDELDVKHRKERYGE